MRCDGISKQLVVSRVASEINSRAVGHEYKIADVGQVIAAKRNGERGADGEITHSDRFVRPDHRGFRSGHTKRLEFFKRFGRRDERSPPARLAIRPDGFRVEMVLVAMRD